MEQDCDICGDGVGFFLSEWVFVLGEEVALWDRSD